MGALFYLGSLIFYSSGNRI